MHKTLIFAGLALLLPMAASAHETRMYEINGVPYEIVMGSLGEPVIVDDKTGIDLEIVRNGTLLTGAQESLQVELIAGDVSRTVSLSPVYGAEGRYKSNFIATVPTTLTYRLFGELEGTPVDLSFTCNPAGHPQAEADENRTEISDGVVQTLKQGAFGCPQEKEAFGFPEAAPSVHMLGMSIEEAQNTTDDQKTDPIAVGALILSLIAGGFAYASYTKKS